MAEYDLPPRLVTDALISDLASGKIAGSDVGATIPGIDSEKQQQFLFELCEAYCNGKLALDKVFEGIKAAGLNGDVSTDLAHAIWFHSLKAGKAEAMGELAGECIKKGKLTKRAVLELEEPAVMAFAGLVTNENVWNAKERKALTNLYYKQDKYNLLREENEGYGKLLTALLSGGTLQQQHLPALTREIKALIGAFKLDPNRVCDLVLDAAERDEAGVDVWLQLMSLFNTEAPKQMLAMKFLHYVQDHRHLSVGDEDNSGKAAEQQKKAPPSLYNLAAAMIKAGHITLEGLLSYLSPTADSLAKSYKEAFEKLQTEVRELSQASLGGTDAGGTAAAADAGGTAAGGTGGRRALLSGNLDTIAKDRGITDDINQGFGSRGGPGMGPPGMSMQPMLQPGVPPGMWQRGLPLPGHPMGGAPGGMGPGGYPGGGGGMYGGVQNGPVGGQGMMMGGSGMRGGGAAPMGGGGSGGAVRGGGGGGGSEAYAASYNVMPASQLELDAHVYDRPLMDGSAGHVQLLLALMKLADWEHAMLLLDYLQSVLGIQAASDLDISKAILAHLQKLLDPVYKALYPRGALGGSVLRRHPYNLDDDASSEPALNPVFPAAQNPPGPALEPLAYQLLGHLGVYVYRNAEVLVMLLRVMKHELMFYGHMWPVEWEQGLQQVDAQKVAQVSRVLAENAFPALALSPANRALSTELWSVLELMPFHNRAEVYRDALAAFSASPPAAAAGQLAVKAFKKVKARLALPDKADKSRKDIVKANTNLLSKVSHATPLQVADQMMWWAASAPNSVEPLAEVLKLPNPLTQDALTYQVLYWWGRLGKNKMKEDGANEEDWVAGLADLVGYACRAHPHHSFNLSIIFGFLFDELKAGETLSVLLLRCILSKMAGIDGPVSLDPSQANQLCAGHIMQAESIHSVANRAEPRFLKGRRALVEVLQEGSEAQQLLVPLAVVMSQHLDWALYALHTKHLKELAELHDRVNEITQQYLMVIEHCISKDKAMTLKDYARALPPLDSLINEYGVHPGIAWMMWRPVVAALEPQLMAKLEANAAAAAAAGDEGDDADMLSLLDTRPAAASKVGSGDGEEGELPEEGEAMQGVEGPGAEVKDAAAAAAAAAAAVAAAAVDLPVTLADVTASVQKLNLDIFTVLTEPLYVAFWSLRPDEIHVPTDLYDARISEMESFIKAAPKEISQLQNGIDSENRLLDGLRHRRLPPREHEMQYNRCIDNLTAKQNGLAEAKQKLEHCQALIGPLRQERDALVTRHKQVMQRLQAEKDQYVQLKQAKMVYKQLCYSFIRSCLVPRLTRSVADATFCHHFIMTLHKIDTPNWPAAFMWDYTVTSLASMIPTVTEKEALCVGVFLTLLLQTLQVWYFDQVAYKRNCSQQTMRQSAINAAAFSHEQFVKLFIKWQNSLFKNLKACANSSEYLQKRNALTIMSKMIQAASDDQPPMFPFYKHHSEGMQTVMKEIQENDPRQDVKKMAQALFIQLTNTIDRCVPNPNPPGSKGKQQVRAPAGKRPVGAPAGRKPPASPGKQQQQPSSRLATPPPAAAAAAEAKTEPAAAAGKGGDSQADKSPAAAGAGRGNAKPAAGTAAAAAGGGGGPKAVRKGPGPTAAKQAAATPAAAGGGSGTPGGTGSTLPPRHGGSAGGTTGGGAAAAAAAADEQPARKRPRVTPTSSKADEAAAATGDEEPGEVPDTDAAAAAATSEGTTKPSAGKAAAPAAATPGEKKVSAAAAGGGKGGDSASKAKQSVAQRVVKKAVAAATAPGDSKGGAKAGAKPAQQQQGKDATPEQKQQQQQQQAKQDEHKQQHKHDGDRHATPDRSRHHAHHDKQQQGREEKESGAKQQQQQRDGSRDRAGRQQDEDDGKGSRRSRRGGDRDGTSDRGEKGSSRDGSGKQQQRESDADGAPREQQPAQQHDKEKEGREKERKRDRREQKSDKQQRDDRRERGSEERGARDNSSEPAKRRRVEDEQQQQPERQSTRQQQQERTSGSGHKQEQQQQQSEGGQQQQQRRSKHAPIMPPPDRPARKDSSDHERSDNRPHSRGRR